jgi:hypothetical protein
LAETWAALVERSVTNDTYRREFVELGDATGVWVLPHLASYLPTQARRLASGTASLGVVRLVANHGDPGYNLWPIPGVTDELLDQLDIGAAAWYGQRASKVLTADIRMAIREAYILERLHSPALPSSPELRTMRLQRLASITLLERRLPLLPPRVQVLLISAKKMVGLGPGV